MPSPTDRQPHEKKEEDQPMTNHKDVINTLYLTEGGAKIVAARYDTNTHQAYHFINALGLDIVVGDRIVVQTRGSMALATVVDPDVGYSSIGCDVAQLVHVICKIDTSALDLLLKQEAAASKKLAMVEVNRKLAQFREAIGGEAISAASNMLLGVADVVEEVPTHQCTHRCGINGYIMELSTGIVIGLAPKSAWDKIGWAVESNNTFKWMQGGSCTYTPRTADE